MIIMIISYKDFAKNQEKELRKIRKRNGKFNNIKLRCWLLIAFPINMITCGIIYTISFPTISNVLIFLGALFIVTNLQYYVLNFFIFIENSYLHSNAEIWLYHRFICGEIQELD